MDRPALNKQVEQASILMQATSMMPETVYVDLGYRAVDKDNPDINIGQMIGHLRSDHRMMRGRLQHSLVTAHDHQKMISFFAPFGGRGFDQFAAQIKPKHVQ